MASRQRIAALALICTALTGFPGLGQAQSRPDGAAPAAASAVPAAENAGAADAFHDAAAAVVERYPPQSIASVAVADAALADVRRARADIDARQRAAQLACRPAFFMTRCLDAAKEKRRAALALLRPVEIEADAFKRRERVVERDRALVEKNARADRDAQQNAARNKTPAPARMPADPATAAAHDGAAARHETGAPATPHPRTPHVAKPLTPKIDAATEARNSAAFDRKAAESAQRQQDIAAKKAEKERERARKRAESQAAGAASAPTSATPAAAVPAAPPAATPAAR